MINTTLNTRSIANYFAGPMRERAYLRRGNSFSKDFGETIGTLSFDKAQFGRAWWPSWGLTLKGLRSRLPLQDEWLQTIVFHLIWPRGNMMGWQRAFITEMPSVYRDRGVTPNLVEANKLLSVNHPMVVRHTIYEEGHSELDQFATIVINEGLSYVERFTTEAALKAGWSTGDIFHFCLPRAAQDYLELY